MASELDKITKGLEALVAKGIKLLTTEVTALLVETTPVDTGWARANWVPAIGQGPRTPAGAPGSPSTGAQDAGLASVVTGYRATSSADVTIANNVPYIRKLNDGHSGQAPAGFVEFSVEVGTARAEQKLKRSV